MAVLAQPVSLIAPFYWEYKGERKTNASSYHKHTEVNNVQARKVDARDSWQTSFDEL